jgi:ribonuclease E
VSREIVVSEADKIAVVLDNGVVAEFYLSEGEQFVGDIILASVESIVPAIEASFLDIGREKSGFIHVSDLPASKKQQSGIRQFLKPQQHMLVQVTREPTGNKGACLTGFIQLPGRYLVLTPFERRIGLSKRIYDARERARLSRIARIICGSGYGIVLRPEAVGQSEQTLRDDLKLLLARWKHILQISEKATPGTTLYRDQDILERILREGATHSVNRIVVDSQATYERALKYLNNWSDTQARNKLRLYSGNVPVLSYYGIYQQLETAIQPLVQLPSGGTLVIQPTEALTSIDINTSSMTSTDNQPETILRTNCEAAEEIARQLVLRDIGGVIVIDFIDMDNPRDQQIVWQKLSDALHGDKAQPQINYFSEFGLVEMTRRRQRQRLSEMLTMPCPTCQGIGRIRNLFYRADVMTHDGMKMRIPVTTPAEKSSRFRAGAEKSVAPPVPTSSLPAPAPKTRENGGRSKPAAQIEKTVSAPPPSMPIVQEPVAKEKPQTNERPEDLLFDESYFTGEITDERLGEFIEREDSLNVSGKLASRLDELLSQIDSDGLQSILQPMGSPEPEEEFSGRERSESRSRDDRAQDSAAEHGSDEFDTSEEAVSAFIEEEEDAAPADDVEYAHQSDSADEPESASSDDEDGSEDAAPEPAVKAKPAKKLLTRRRTIRSFKPKK